MGRSKESTERLDEVATNSQDSHSVGVNAISRRQLLAIGSVSAMTIVVGGCLRQRDVQDPSSQGMQDQPVRAQPGDLGSQPASPLGFLEPDDVIPDQPDLHVKMNLSFEISFFDPTTGKLEKRTIKTRTYNGKVPGPTYHVKRGQKMEFRVINELAPNTYPAEFYKNRTSDRKTCAEYAEREIPHCFNTTNLHTHGLHVSPTTKEEPDRFLGISSDDVLVRIPPKNDSWDDPRWPSERRYCIQLPEFHAPGTHWYHAHIHGSTAIQVVDGMAGALIVEEEEDEKVKDGDTEIREKVWIIQEIAGVQNGNVSDTQVYANLTDSEFNVKPFGTTPPPVRFTVNSLAAATLKMKTDEIQRWRFINATGTPRGFMNIAITEPHETNPGGEPGTFVAGAMALIAEDGITYYGRMPKEVTDPGHFLAPAYRADFLVQLPKKLPEGKKYEVWKRKVTNHSIRGSGSGPTQDQLLALIELEGPDGQPKHWPQLPSWVKAPCYLKPITENIKPENMRTFKFNVNAFGAAFGEFTINDKPYSQSADIEVDLGSVEEWTLENTSNSAHPIHIHVNPFQVVEIFDPHNPEEGSIKFGPEEAEKAIWKDTIVVPPGKNENNVIVPGHVKFRTRFLTYHGTYVMHCHILIHEDVGMMVNVKVRDKDGKGQPPCKQVTECKLTL